MKDDTRYSCIVIHMVHTLYGGVASVAANLINEQIKNGILPMIAYVNDDAAIDTMLETNVNKIKVEVKTIPGYSMMFGMKIRKVYEDVKRKNPNTPIIVHAHNVQTVGLMSNLQGIPLVCSLHSLRGSDKGIRPYISDTLYRGILRKIARNKGKLTSVSNAISEFYNKDGLDITTVYNGIQYCAERDEHDKFIIAHIGNISTAKGWDVVCEGFSMVPYDIRKKMRFISVGKEATYTKEDMLRILEDKKILEQSEYLGFVNNAGEKIIPKIDLLVLASRNEGLGLVLIEALSRGVPVMGTNTGGICEVLKDGYNGFAIQDSKDLAMKIQELYENKELYEEMSINAQNTYKEKFTVEKMFEQYNDIYIQELKLFNGDR